MMTTICGPRKDVCSLPESAWSHDGELNKKEAAAAAAFYLRMRPIYIHMCTARDDAKTVPFFSFHGGIDRWKEAMVDWSIRISDLTRINLIPLGRPMELVITLPAHNSSLPKI